MAIVGDAYIVVRAIGNSVKRDIERDFNGMGKAGQKAGRDAARGFRRGARQGGGFRFFGADFFKNSDEAVEKFRRLSVAQNILFTAIPAVLGGIGALGSGLLVLVGVLGQAAASSIVLASALGGLVNGAIATKLAFKGVGTAIKAGLDAQKQSASNTRAQEAATRRLRDARLALKKLIEEEKPEALAEARERAVRAEEASADASIANGKAIRTYNSAQKETLDALEDLNRARERARDRIRQLRFELEGGAISEKKARLEFEKARDSLQRVQDLPPNSRARQEAELAFAEAELNLRKAIDNNKDLKKAEQASTAAGVEGSDEVVGAKERIVSAQQAEVDAGIAAAKAARDAGRAQVKAAKAASAAAAGGSVEKDMDERIASAREQVKLAGQAASDAASGGVNKFNEALKDLSPEQQNFVKFMIAQQDAFKGLRAAAAREFLPEVEKALTIIISKFDELEPLFQDTGRILGELSVDFAETFFQGENFERLKSVFADNNELLEKLGTAVINIAEGFLILLDNASPLVEAFGNYAVNTSEAWKNTQILKDQSGELAEQFGRVQERVEQVTGIFGTYKEAFGDIFAVINQPGGAGDQLLTYFDEASTSFRDFIAAGKEDGSLNEFFTNSNDNFIKILDLISNIGGGLLNLGASPGLGTFIDSLNNVTDTFNDLGLRLVEPGGPIETFGLFLEEVARFLDLATESGALDAFFDTLFIFAQTLNDLIASDVGQFLFKLLAPAAGVLLAFSQIAKFVAFFTTVFATLFTRVKLGFGGIAKFILGGLRAAMNFFGGQVLRILGQKGALGFLGRIFAFLGRVFSFIIRFAGPIGFIIGILLAAIPIIIANWDKIKGFFINLFDNIKDVFQGVADFFIGVVESIIEFIQPVIDFFVAYFTAAFDIIRGIVEVIEAIFKIAFVLIATRVLAAFDQIKDAFKAVGDFIKRRLQPLIDLFKDIFESVKRIVIARFEALRDGFKEFIEFIRPAIEGIFGFFETTFNNISDFFKLVMNRMIGFAEGFINFFIDGLNFIIRRINDVSIPIPGPLQGVFDGAETLGFNIRPVSRISLPRLAEGGIVKSTPGGVLSLIGEAGRSERVEPLDATGLSRRDRAIIDRLSSNQGNGTTINVYPSAGMNERDLAELVSKRLAFQLRRGAA